MTELHIRGTQNTPTAFLIVGRRVSWTIFGFYRDCLGSR